MSEDGLHVPPEGMCAYCWDMGKRAAKAKAEGLIFHCDPCPACEAAPPSSHGTAEEGLNGNQ
jgi:hypothetical protein